MYVTKLCTKRGLSAALFLFVSLLFAPKYLERYTDWPIVASSALLLFYGLILYKKELFGRINFNYGVVATVLYLLVSVFLFTRIDIHSLNVDRWSVISSYWDAWFRGDYVYKAQSFDGNYPGPSPFYFLLALPFYRIGELGVFSLLGMVLFEVVCYYYKVEKKRLNYGLFLLTVSLFYLWEVTCRSNIFTNSVLILLGVLFLLYNKLSGWRWVIVNALLIGLLMATRNIFAIAYIIAFMYFLISKEKKFGLLFLTGVLSLLVYALTFVPFVWGHWDAFLEINPFIIQGSFLMPFHYTLFCLVLAFAFSFLCKSKKDIIFYSGINLFLTTLLYVGYQVSVNGFTKAYYGSSADISYFIFCTPFLLYYFLAESD